MSCILAVLSHILASYIHVCITIIFLTILIVIYTCIWLCTSYTYVRHCLCRCTRMPTYLLDYWCDHPLIANILRSIRYLRTIIVHVGRRAALLCPALLHCVTAKCLCCDVLGGGVQARRLYQGGVAACLWRRLHCDGDTGRYPFPPPWTSLSLLARPRTNSSRV